MSEWMIECVSAWESEWVEEWVIFYSVSVWESEWGCMHELVGIINGIVCYKSEWASQSVHKWVNEWSDQIVSEWVSEWGYAHEFMGQ